MAKATATAPLRHASADVVIAALTPLPEVQKALAAQDAARQTERANSARALVALEAARAEEYAAGLAEAARESAAVVAAEKALIQARKRYLDLESRRRVAAFDFEHKRDEIVSRLRETADPAIGRFIAEMWSIIAAPPQPSLTVEVKEATLLKKRSESVSSDWDAIAAYLDKVRGAIAAAELLVLDADNNNIAERLAALRPTRPEV